MTVTSETLWTQFATRLRHFIRGRVADAAAVEDILQNVFLKIQQRLGTLRGSDKLEAWVHQIARNAIVDHYRARRSTEELSEEMPDERQDASGTALEEGERTALLAAFHRMIEALPEPYREAIRLTELEGLTQQALADRLGLSLSGAKSRVQRGRALLKEMLLECCRFEFDRRGGILDCAPKEKNRCKECG